MVQWKNANISFEPLPRVFENGFQSKFLLNFCLSGLAHELKKE